MSIDWSKPVQTRNGWKARIVCMDAKTLDDRPICALYDNNGSECCALYKLDGTVYPHPSNIDLINVPEERWAVLLPVSSNAVRSGSYFVAATEQEARERMSIYPAGSARGPFKLVED